MVERSPPVHESVAVPRRRAVLRALVAGSLAGFAGCNAFRQPSTQTPPPVTPARTLTESTKLAPADGSSKALFGKSVALTDTADTALIGAYKEDAPDAPEAGSAYVFERSGGKWTEAATLTPDSAYERSWYGEAVALADDTVLIGAPRADTTNGEEAGVAFIFEKSGGKWTKVATLTPSDGDSGDEFGGSVALTDDGDTALISAPGDDEPNGEKAGAVYVFERAVNGWTETVKLTPADGSSRDHFGKSVAVDGDTALIGASWHGDQPSTSTPTPLSGSGAAYVFRLGDSEWSERSILTASDADGDVRFGTAVALENDTALITAVLDDDPNGANAGSAYVFERSDDEWAEVAKLTPNDGDKRDKFGSSAALAENGDTALIGAKHDGAPIGAKGDEEFKRGIEGSAYLFERTGDEWAEAAKLVRTERRDGHGFGESVALAGDTALIGATGVNNAKWTNLGAGYVFKQ